MTDLKSFENTSYDRLIAAVRTQWASVGAAAMSARQISALTAVPVSSIYHHFGSMEHLFAAAQGECLSRAGRWCKAQMDQVAGLQASPAAFAGFFAQVVDSWCEEARELAFAWRECQLVANQSALFRQTAQKWEQLWEGFWTDATERFGLPAKSMVVQRVFDNESFLHMIRWRRLIDRPALEETARALTAWLTGTAMPPAPWREFAREEALASMPVLPERDETAARIVGAAADIIDKQGLARLTHRAVAERAGLTLGTVSHKFRTKLALYEGAFEGLYRVNVQRMPSRTSGHGGAANDMVDMIRRGGTTRGTDELFVATARDAALSQFGAQLRYMRGRTSRGTLQDMVGHSRRVGIMEAALFSSFLSSQLRVHSAGGADREQRIRTELAALEQLLQSVPAA
ncbi:helix-turn-helix domain-containing protein [Novosphingobium panipatense]|uniref:Transcriptional regulator, TetR family n=2 Tax=Novosphingobium panipatense TaxID=428991 RepID=A0ABY1Q5M0_9SPHN|nr:helix-turn-helix domain-containing protein [Novosphingobium panipatense]SMP60520.1 transcriptional regulator, TetR family [Novosphingobium panipatense]